MTATPLQTPFPYFGGKRKAAETVWPAFGRVDNYVEPFAGSAAMLLAAPPDAARIETINDFDGFVANFWRAIAHAPDAAAHAACGKGGGFTARNRLECGNGPLVVDHVQDHRRAVHVGKGQRGVEVGFGGGAVADPGRRDARVALDRRRHGPAHGLRKLRGQVARDAEEIGPLERVHDRQLPALERIGLVAHQLADQLRHRHVFA